MFYSAKFHSWVLENYYDVAGMLVIKRHEQLVLICATKV